MKVDLTLTEMERLVKLIESPELTFEAIVGDAKERERLREKLCQGIVRHYRTRKPKRQKDQVPWDQWCSYMDEVPGLIRWDAPTTREVAKFQYYKTPWRHPFMVRVRAIFTATNRTYSPYDVLIRTIDKPDWLEFTARLHGTGTRPLTL